jgi:hypothetical protein
VDTGTTKEVVAEVQVRDDEIKLAHKEMVCREIEGREGMEVVQVVKYLVQN